MKKITSLVLVATIGVGLTGCKSPSKSVVDPSATADTTNTEPDIVIKTAVFIDKEVQGLEYKTKTQSGITNAKGEFSYAEGEEEVTLSIGGIGFNASIPANNIITPLTVFRLIFPEASVS